MRLFDYEEQPETMAFLKLINMGKKEIAEVKFQSVENFFTDRETDVVLCFSD
ncbi:MAG: hypothetical protein WCL42_08715 [Chlorobiaceae bacterium]